MDIRDEPGFASARLVFMTSFRVTFYTPTAPGKITTKAKRIVSTNDYEQCMMTSSNGNIFRVTGPLCGEFTGPGDFPTQRPVTRSFDVFFDLRLNKRWNKQPWGWWFETPSRSSWRQCNGHSVTWWNDGTYLSANDSRHTLVSVTTKQLFCTKKQYVRCSYVQLHLKFDMDFWNGGVAIYMTVRLSEHSKCFRLNTLGSRPNCCPFTDDFHFQMHFLGKKIMNFVSDFIEVFS